MHLKNESHVEGYYHLYVCFINKDVLKPNTIRNKRNGKKNTSMPWKLIVFREITLSLLWLKMAKKKDKKRRKESCLGRDKGERERELDYKSLRREK